ncbi:MAG TPA: acyl-CoA dehydrogenase, partial [Flavobacteriales bacterium]|nr:acyl-CoA dehydrogenase [Flavobacteriales bacterium]
MNFKESEDQRAIRATVRDFAEKEILPHRMEWDEGQIFPRSLFSEMGELGLMGMLVPTAYGGAGMGYFEYKIAIEEVAKVCG